MGVSHVWGLSGLICGACGLVVHARALLNWLQAQSQTGITALQLNTARTHPPTRSPSPAASAAEAGRRAAAQLLRQHRAWGGVGSRCARPRCSPPVASVRMCTQHSMVRKQGVREGRQGVCMCVCACVRVIHHAKPAVKRELSVEEMTRAPHNSRAVHAFNQSRWGGGGQRHRAGSAALGRFSSPRAARLPPSCTHTA